MEIEKRHISPAIAEFVVEQLHILKKSMVLCDGHSFREATEVESLRIENDELRAEVKRLKNKPQQD